MPATGKTSPVSGNPPPPSSRVLPAEWEKHEATWITWPHNPTDWPGKMRVVQWVYTEIAGKISASEKCVIVVPSAREKDRVERFLQDAGALNERIAFFVAKTNRSWIRDYGPIHVRKKPGGRALEIPGFRFNGWGNRFTNYRQDEHFKQRVSRAVNVPLSPVSHKGGAVVLEGGAIDSNGAGALLTTEECLLDPKTQVRNPGFTRKDYEKVFAEHLGIRRTIWLGNGIAGDDTHGHVDDICRFVKPSMAVLAQAASSDKENYRALKDNRERLKDVKIDGRNRLEVVELPMPEPRYFRGIRLPASYANFIYTNDALLVPVFNDPNDSRAIGILSEIIKDREIIGIYALDLVVGCGSLHCLSMQEPKK